MRTAPVALAYLDEEDALAEAARAVSELTYYDTEAGDACVLWCLAIRHAMCTGALDVRVGLSHIDVSRRALWLTRLDEAESSRPSDFANNGWVVAALQAAWSAIATTAVPVDEPAAGLLRADHLGWTRGGGQRQTVGDAGAVGRLTGSACRSVGRLLDGWPVSPHGVWWRWPMPSGVVAGGSISYYTGWSGTDTLVRHPHDDGMWIGGVGALRSLPDGVDAVCRRAASPSDLPRGVEQVDVRLIDSDAPADDPNLEFVLLDTVRLVEQLRHEGRAVSCTARRCSAAHRRSRHSTAPANAGSAWSRRSATCARFFRAPAPTRRLAVG